MTTTDAQTIRDAATIMRNQGRNVLAAQLDREAVTLEAKHDAASKLVDQIAAEHARQLAWMADADELNDGWLPVCRAGDCGWTGSLQRVDAYDRSPDPSDIAAHHALDAARSHVTARHLSAENGA